MIYDKNEKGIKTLCIKNCITSIYSFPSTHSMLPHKYNSSLPSLAMFCYSISWNFFVVGNVYDVSNAEHRTEYRNLKLIGQTIMMIIYALW